MAPISLHRCRPPRSRNPPGEAGTADRKRAYWVREPSPRPLGGRLMSIRSWLPIRPRRWRRPFVLAAGGTLVPVLVFAGLYVFLLVRGSPAPFSLTPAPVPAPGPAVSNPGRVGATVSTSAGAAGTAS